MILRLDFSLAVVLTAALMVALKENSARCGLESGQPAVDLGILAFFPLILACRRSLVVLRVLGPGTRCDEWRGCIFVLGVFGSGMLSGPIAGTTDWW